MSLLFLLNRQDYLRSTVVILIVLVAALAPLTITHTPSTAFAQMPTGVGTASLNTLGSLTATVACPAVNPGIDLSTGTNGLTGTNGAGGNYLGQYVADKVGTPEASGRWSVVSGPAITASFLSYSGLPATFSWGQAWSIHPVYFGSTGGYATTPWVFSGTAGGGPPWGGVMGRINWISPLPPLRNRRLSWAWSRLERMSIP
ncbi:MAG: hypothetical protein ACLPY5_09210 [Candidatus Bathyarchaeia archaeon]